MKRKTLKGSSRKRRESGKMKGTLGLGRHLQFQLGFPLQYQQQPGPSTSASGPSSTLFQNLLDSEVTDPELHSTEAAPASGDVDMDDRDFILSQDFFCTPDYITPDNQNLLSGFDCNKENIPCPKSPEKINTVKAKKLRQAYAFRLFYVSWGFGDLKLDAKYFFLAHLNVMPDFISLNPLSPTLSEQPEDLDLAKDRFTSDEVKIEKINEIGTEKPRNYMSQSAVALRCRVMPPPCLQNPYLKDASEVNVDPFDTQRSKCAGFFPANVGGVGLSRYHTDFHEIQQIGAGNFSCVFKVLKRIDGCLYAVKRSTRQLHQDAERRKALMEVQALAALGCHENVVGYYSSWFEDEQLYIQMELCDCSLSLDKHSKSFTEAEASEMLHQIDAIFDCRYLQIAKALQFIHKRGIAHLDVKPENIYVKNGVYKLGDFGCATLLDQSLPIEEGDARYMPQEILNEEYDHLEKVDIFSLGASIYELIRGASLPELGSQLLNLRKGKLPLLPGHSLQFQNLIKAMVDPDPARRPTARELVENPLFTKVQRNLKASAKP
ncbi:hypothetical protein Tsubulata_041078 [Turnera subulata]|uniref:Wee1-like protein kinase n=1 Tax=Turnera subulata TaxID=218843 RepID=A0A9Q0FRX0_9ROSI|nr:hypothetical protein Tsubulata_041078 [Turnera subulata]